MKVVFRWKFIALSTYVNKSEKSQKNNLMIHLRAWNNINKPTPQSVNRKNTMIKAEINKIETKNVKNQ